MNTFQALSISALAFSIPAVGAMEERQPTRYERIYDEFINIKADQARIAHVSNLSIIRDAGNFFFQDGTFYLCTPIDRKDRVCVFLGKGSFLFTPPNEIERAQTQRTLEKDSLGQEFHSLLLVVGDSTIEELKTKLQFNPGAIPPEVSSYLKSSLKYQGEKDGKNADFFIMKTFLEDNRNELFYTQFNSKGETPLMFLIDPYDEEQVCLLRRAKSAHYQDRRDVISQFQAGNRAPNQDLMTDWFRCNKYTLEINIADNLDFSASAEIAIDRAQRDDKWLSFLLIDELVVDSVLSARNVHLSFFKGELNPLLWIEYPLLPDHSLQDTVRIFYHGDAIKKDDASIYLKSSLDWCPLPYTGKSAYQKKRSMDVTYRIPSTYSIVSVGKCVSRSTTEEQSITRWITEKPVRHFSFNIGKFKEHHVTQDSLPPVTVLMTPSGDSDVQEDVASDIQSSVDFYQFVYGPCPFSSLYACDIPSWSGEAYPGMINLSNSTFQSSDEISYDVAFRAHEVAHQWWGISVGFHSYHDQWLSEGFAEYSSYWFTQLRLKNNKKFFDLLTGARKRIFQARKYLLSSGQKTGPISLGYRNETSATKGDYFRIVYGKGAWVLHMIRNMMLDSKTMDEKPFMRMMKEFYSEFRDSAATTNDFKKIVEKYLNQDMTWFFDQWVYGIELPTYSFDYSKRRLPDGKYAVHCTVVTEDVSERFKMPVLLYLDFGDRRYYRLRVWVQGRKCEFDLPILPLEPKDILFNDLSSVLCEVD